MDWIQWTWQLIGECGWVAWLGWACFIIAFFLRYRVGSNRWPFILFCVGCALVLIAIKVPVVDTGLYSNKLFFSGHHSTTSYYQYFLPSYMGMSLYLEGCIAHITGFLFAIFFSLPLLIHFLWKPDFYTLWIFKYLAPLCFILILFYTKFLNLQYPLAPFDFFSATLPITITLSIFALLIIFFKKQFPIRLVIYISSMGLLDAMLVIRDSYAIFSEINSTYDSYFMLKLLTIFLLDQLCVLYPLCYSCLILTPLFIFGRKYITTSMLRKFRWSFLSISIVLFSFFLHLLFSFLFVIRIDATLNKPKSEGSIPTFLDLENKKLIQENLIWHLNLKTIINSKSNFDPIVNNDNKHTSTLSLNQKPIGSAVDGLTELRTRIRKLSKEQRKELHLIIHPEADTPLWDIVQIFNICRLENVMHVRTTELKQCSVFSVQKKD